MEFNSKRVKNMTDNKSTLREYEKYQKYIGGKL